MSVTALRPATSYSSITVAAPGEADVPALIALINTLAAERNQLFIQPVDPISGRKLVSVHLAAIAASGNEVVLVARDRDQLVGLITGMRGDHPARRGVVEIGIGVRASHRSQGVGFALMMALERWAREAGCHRLSLRVVTRNTPAIALYRKAGFAVEGMLEATAILDGLRIDELQMGKTLGPTAPR
ncbi:MAG TPA: GNAT family N-acetyltransferase [Stellaceae bacterium]|jgi:RimJ/RimL family protein N-acetyltransferase|nr:GNAT family N-acetyltransferase [Stellaceae bacterium]